MGSILELQIKGHVYGWNIVTEENNEKPMILNAWPERVSGLVVLFVILCDNWENIKLTVCRSMCLCICVHLAEYLTQVMN